MVIYFAGFNQCFRANQCFLHCLENWIYGCSTIILFRMFVSPRAVGMKDLLPRRRVIIFSFRWS